MTVTQDTFEAEVLKADMPVMVDFWADWCGPCKMLAPIIDDLEEQFKGRIKVCKVNVDTESSLAVQYKVANIPTIVFFKNGEVADKSVGIIPKDKIAEKMEALL